MIDRLRDVGGADHVAGQLDSAPPDVRSLLGRDYELGAVRDLIGGLADQGQVVIVRGQPGAGKSSIACWAAEYAAGRSLMILQSVGIQAEAQMPLAGLHQLLTPVMDHAQVLPAAQRDALASAFGVADDSPDLFLTALATLNLLGELSASRPVVLVADDVHWLDDPTCEVLAFVGRRLKSDPILLLATIRDGYRTALDDVGAREIILEGLAEDDAGELIDLHSPGLAAPLRERVLVEAEGNPLALIELPITWRSCDPGLLTDHLPLSERLEQAFAARFTSLPATAGTLVLIAALNDSPSVGEVLRAGERLCEPAPDATDLVSAQEVGLVTLDDDCVRFSHPLVRSAVRQVAGAARRSSAHAALAYALRDDRDRSVWHRAAASLGPDDEIARDLDGVAIRARQRGGLAVAAAALERAASLSLDTAARGARLIKAAELEHELGLPDRATELLRGVHPTQLDEVQRRRLMWLREFIRETHGTVSIADSIALAAHMQTTGDSQLALDGILTAALKAYWFNARADERDAIITVAESLPVGDHEPKLLAALSLADPIHRGGFVIECLTRVGPEAFVDPEDVRTLGIALIVIPEYDLAGRFLAAAVDGLREQGRLMVLARALGSQAHAALFRGEFALAEQAAEEGVRLARETHQPRWECSCHTFLGHVCGVSGDAERAEAQILLAEKLLPPPRSTPALQHFQLARGATSLAAGQPDVAYDQISRIFDPADPAYNPLVGTPGLIDLADAALATDRVAAASQIVEAVDPSVQATGAHCLQSKVRYARALLAGTAEAEALYESALEQLQHDARWERARLRLAYGAWLRRRRRALDARRSLRIAREEFDAIDTPPWADRAREELRATGERSRRRVPETRDELSAQEMHIARLAAEGLSNREIGKRLFLSHRTVGSHLYRIFPKLGVASRAELARAMLVETSSLDDDRS